MSKNKKFFLVLFVFIFIPNVLVWTAPLMENKVRGFYLNDYKNLIIWIANITILGPILVLFLNNRSGSPSKVWNVVSIIILILIILYLLVINSMANYQLF